MRPEYLIYTALFILIGLMFVSFFLVWHWYDARELLSVVRGGSRDETIRAIRRGHNKCRVLLLVGILVAAGVACLPYVLRDFKEMEVYPALVAVVDIVLLIILRVRTNKAIASVDDYIAENEEHVREAAAELDQKREQWRNEAAERNPVALARIKEALGDNYETWYRHDILLERNVLANTEEKILYAQGVVLPFSQIMEIRKGRKDLKLVTNNSMYPFVTLDFGKLTINPETGEMYKDEIAELIKRQMP